MHEQRRLAERHWVVPHGASWLKVYQNSVFDESRPRLAAALRRLAPFRSLLDLGCHCGCLVPLFQAASHDVAVTGVDLSDEALQMARQMYPSHHWEQGSFVDWLHATTETFEIAVAASSIGHVPPDDIDLALAGLSKVTTRAIVMQAQTAVPGFPEGPTTSSVWEWRYNYPKRLIELGWQITSSHWLQTKGPQPNALLVFERMKT